MDRSRKQIIEELLHYISEEYCLPEDALEVLKKKALGISEDALDAGRRYAKARLLLSSGNSLDIAWDVDCLINYASLMPERMRIASAYELEQGRGKKLSGVLDKQSAGLVVCPYGECGKIDRDVKYVFVMDVPHLGIRCIVDGKHYFYEALVENKPVRYFKLMGDECLLFLQPGSRSIVEFCAELDRLMRGKGDVTREMRSGSLEVESRQQVSMVCPHCGVERESFQKKEFVEVKASYDMGTGRGERVRIWESGQKSEFCMECGKKI